MKTKIYNPNNLPVEDLPVIYGFNNGGNNYCYSGILLSEDGKRLGQHICSNESFMLCDLGILEGTGIGRDITFKLHYPEGFKMEFVSYERVPSHARLLRAVELWMAKNEKK